MAICKEQHARQWHDEYVEIVVTLFAVPVADLLVHIEATDAVLDRLNELTVLLGYKPECRQLTVR